MHGATLKCYFLSIEFPQCPPWLGLSGWQCFTMWVQEALPAFPKVCSPRERDFVFIHHTGLQDEEGSQSILLIHAIKMEGELQEKTFLQRLLK